MSWPTPNRSLQCSVPLGDDPKRGCRHILPLPGPRFFRDLTERVGSKEVIHKNNLEKAAAQTDEWLPIVSPLADFVVLGHVSAFGQKHSGHILGAIITTGALD